MLFCRTSHKGTFVKEVFTGRFTDLSNNCNNNSLQTLVISESSLELYDYYYEESLSLPFLEPKLNQELFLQILDAKIMKQKHSNIEVIVLLTTSGLIIFKYSEEANAFTPICSEVLNINCEERDKLMYLTVEENLGIIVAYSNTSSLFIYKVNINASNIVSSSLTLLNAEINVTMPYIQEVFIFSKEGNNICKDINEEGYLFSVGVVSKSDNFLDCSIIMNFNEDFKGMDHSISNKFLICDQMRNLDIIPPFTELNFYRFIISPYANFLLFIGEQGIVCSKTNSTVNLKTDTSIDIDNLIAWTKIFKNNSEILCSYLIFDNFIQLNFENKVMIFQEDIYNKKLNKIKITGSKSQIFDKKVIRLSSKDYFFLYYDHNMNFLLTKYNLTPDKVTGTLAIEINILNRYNNHSFYCLDSALTHKNSNENIIYSLCGFKGSSKLIKLEKAFNETKIHSIDYDTCNSLKVVENKNKDQILFLSNGDITSILKFSNQMKFTSFNNNNNSLSSLELYEKTINANIFLINQQEVYSHICENSIRLYEFNQDLSNLSHSTKHTFTDKIIQGTSFTFSDTVYFLLYFNTGSFAVYHFSYENDANCFLEDSKFNFSFEVSCFDFIINSNKLFLVICTYNNRIEMYNYEFSNKSFTFSSFISLENNEKTEIIPESVRIYKRFICISTRTGEFCLFYMAQSEGEFGIPEILYSVNLGRKETLTICDSGIEDLGEDDLMAHFSVDLFNNTLAYNLEIKVPVDLKVKVSKIKYIIKSEKDNVNNNLTFFNKFKASSGLPVSLYQNQNKIYLSHFSKTNNNTLLPDEVIQFNSNQMARRVVSFDHKTMIILIESFIESKYGSNLNLNNTSTLDSTQLLIYNSDNNFRKLIELDDRVKIHTMKMIDIIYTNNEEMGSQIKEEVVRYLGLTGQYEGEVNASKGFLFLYECKLDDDGCLLDLKLIRKINVGNQTIYDFCQIKDHLVISSDNGLGAIRLELDHKSKKVIFNGCGKQTMLNRIISLFSVPDSFAVVIGDINESFSLVEYDPRKNRFETIAADLALRSLYKAFPDENTTNSVVLIQKTGSFSKFRLRNEIYNLTNSYDTKEFINRCHTIKPYFLCTTILGSLLTFLELPADEIMTNYGVSIEDLNNFQSTLTKLYSQTLYNKVLSIEQLRNMSEPVKNVFIVDMYEQLVKSANKLSDVSEIKKIENYEKIVALLNVIKEATENFI